LRNAVAANRGYLPNLIDLAWGISREDVNVAAQLIGVRDDTDRLALIRFLARRGKGKETVVQMRLLSAPLPKPQKDEVVYLLFSAKDFKDAFEVWSSSPARTAALFNGGFEES